MDNIRCEFVQRLAAGGEPTSEEEAAKQVDGMLATLHAALSRTSGMSVDALQAAAYHRRWALTCGASNVERNSLLRTPLVGATNAVGVNDNKSDVKPTKVADDDGASGAFPEWHGDHIVIDSDDDAAKNKVISSSHSLVSGEDNFNCDFVNQGSPTSIFDDISISSISFLSESKLIKNLSEFLSFE